MLDYRSVDFAAFLLESMIHKVSNGNNKTPITLSPIIMLQWKIGMSPIVVTFQKQRFPISMILGGRVMTFHFTG